MFKKTDQFWRLDLNSNSVHLTQELNKKSLTYLVVV